MDVQRYATSWHTTKNVAYRDSDERVTLWLGYIPTYDDFEGYITDEYQREDIIPFMEGNGIRSDNHDVAATTWVESPIRLSQFLVGFAYPGSFISKAKDLTGDPYGNCIFIVQNFGGKRDPEKTWLLPYIGTFIVEFDLDRGTSSG